MRRRRDAAQAMACGAGGFVGEEASHEEIPAAVLRVATGHER